MLSIPDNLYLRLRATLMDLDEFTDDDTLRDVIQNSRLRPWRNRLRDTANRTIVPRAPSRICRINI